MEVRASRAAWYPPPIPAGRTVIPVGPSAANTSSVLNSGTLRLTPFLLPHPTPIVALGAEITAAGDAGSVLRLGVYLDNGTGLPGARLVDAGTIPGDVVGVAEVPVALTLPAGLLWIGGAVQNAPTVQPTVRTVAGFTAPMLMPIGAMVSGATVTGYSQVAVPGALPATFSGVHGSPIAAAPRCHFRT